MKLKTDCKHFSWKNKLLVSMNKINQNMLKEPHCDLNKMLKGFNCPTECDGFKKKL